MGFLSPFKANKSSVSRHSQDTARSADRIIRWHNFYSTVDSEDEKPIRHLYLRELKIMIGRCLKLSLYLLLDHCRSASDKNQPRIATRALQNEVERQLNPWEADNSTSHNTQEKK